MDNRHDSTGTNIGYSLLHLVVPIDIVGSIGPIHSTSNCAVRRDALDDRESHPAPRRFRKCNERIANELPAFEVDLLTPVVIGERIAITKAFCSSQGLDF